MNNKTRVMKGWLKCDTIGPGRYKGDRQITVTGAEGDMVTHIVPAGHIHPNPKLKMVLVCVFKDNQGWWIRFPVDIKYSPFRVVKDQLRKA